MILHCSYEEARALRRGAGVLLGLEVSVGPVIAPPQEIEAVEALTRRLDGDLSISTLTELQGVRSALEAITEALRLELDSWVLQTHPGGEEAVNAYFDYAHALTAMGRAQELEAEMAAMIELMTGKPVSELSAVQVVFPD